MLRGATAEPPAELLQPSALQNRYIHNQPDAVTSCFAIQQAKNTRSLFCVVAAHWVDIPWSCMERCSTLKVQRQNLGSTPRCALLTGSQSIVSWLHCEPHAEGECHLMHSSSRPLCQEERVRLRNASFHTAIQMPAMQTDRELCVLRHPAACQETAHIPPGTDLAYNKGQISSAEGRHSEQGLLLGAYASTAGPASSGNSSEDCMFQFRKPRRHIQLCMSNAESGGEAHRVDVH